MPKSLTNTIHAQPLAINRSEYGYHNTMDTHLLCVCAGDDAYVVRYEIKLAGQGITFDRSQIGALPGMVNKKNGVSLWEGNTCESEFLSEVHSAICAICTICALDRYGHLMYTSLLVRVFDILRMDTVLKERRY